jgi:uncharacterized protein (DUF58 family)
VSLAHVLRRRFAQWALRGRSPESAPIRLTQHRIYVLPTRAGLASAAALPVFLVASLNYNLGLGYALSFMLAGLGIVCIYHSFRNLFGLCIAPGHADPVFAGEMAHFHLRLTGSSNAPSWAIRFVPAWPDEGTAQAIVDIPLRAETLVRLGIPAPTRGLLRLPRLHIETVWPLGLIRAWSLCAPDMVCVVYPLPAAHAPRLPWSGERWGAPHEGASNNGDDFSGLRRQQPGDSPRHIDWKAAARRNPESPLLTKQFSGAHPEELRLDWQLLPAGMGLEQGIACMARWVLDAHAQGCAWSLHLPDQHIPGHQGSAHVHACLKALALYAPPGQEKPR